MSTATRQFRPRPVLAAGAAALLLHYLAAGWLGVPLHAPGSKEAPPAPRTISAQLKLDVPQAGPAPAVVEKAAMPVVMKPGTAQARPHAQPGYKVDLPPAATLTMDLVRRDEEGVESRGEAVVDWQREGARYRLRVVATVGGPAPERLAELVSEGTTGTAGIAPRSMTEQRRSRAQTATHFNAGSGRVTFSASQASVPLAPGTQDKATFPMQLAAIGRADPAQLAAGIGMLVGESRDASVFRFVKIGEEDIETGMGRLATWHVARLPAPGSYNARIDIWLAPGHHWYPVQVRSTEAGGTVTTQTIRSIVIKEN